MCYNMHEPWGHYAKWNETVTSIPTQTLTVLYDPTLLLFSRCHVQLFVTPWTAALQAFLSFTISQNLFKLMSLEAVMPSNYLFLCHHLLLPPSLFPSIRVFSSESALHIRWLKYWSFSLSTSPSNEYSGLLPLELMVGSPCIPRESQVSSPISQFESIKKLSGLASRKGSQRVRQDWTAQHKHMGRWILPWSTDPYMQKAPDFVNDSSWAEGVSIIATMCLHGFGA